MVYNIITGTIALSAPSEEDAYQLHVQADECDPAVLLSAEKPI
jgi:hypothetical protein